MKKISLQTKIFIGIIVLLLGYIVLKTTAKNIYENIREKLIIKDESIIKDLDSIEKLRVKENIYYKDAIRDKDIEIADIGNQLASSNLRNRLNEKKLNDYRNGDFDNNFILFTEHVTKKDSIFWK